MKFAILYLLSRELFESDGSYPRAQEPANVSVHRGRR